MPVKPLPKKLVARLRKIVRDENQRAAKHLRKSRTNAFLGKLKNIDHRRHNQQASATNVSFWGRRIRQLHVSRNFPGVSPVVLKKVEFASARSLVNTIVSAVEVHNKKFNPSNYVLCKPYAYVIDQKLVAMAKTNAPSIAEILGRVELGSLRAVTHRGKRFFDKLKKTHGVNETQLKMAFQDFQQHMRYEQISFISDNMLLLGFKNGKFIFMPLVDLPIE